MDNLVEKIARIYAKNEGFDPDGAHFDNKLVEDKASGGTKLELRDSGKKKWELFTGRAEANIEIFKLLKEELK